MEVATIIMIVKAVAIAAASTAASYAINKLTTPRPAPISIGEQSALEVTTSRYGTIIPRVYGDQASLAGQWIWRAVQPFRGVQTTPGGKHHPGTVTYSFHIDAAATVCVNPNGTKILGVSRIKFDDVVQYPPPVNNAPMWVNGNPYFGVLPIVDGTANRIRIGQADRTATTLAPGPSNSFEIRLGQQEQKDIPVDFYYDNQGEDWTAGYQTDINYGVQPYTAPSYTNQVTIWIKALNLENWNRRLPQITVEVVSADNTVAEIVIAEAQLAGLNPSDLDVTAGVGVTVNGLVIPDVMPPKEVIGMLGIAYNFAMPLVDGKLKLFSLVPEAGPWVIQLAEAGVLTDGPENNQEAAPKWQTLITQATEMPQRVEISFVDAGRAYGRNRVGWGRLTSTNKGLIAFDWPMTLTADEAIAICKRVLYTTWGERIQYQSTWLPKYLQFHPGDVVQVTTPEGVTVDTRIVKQNFAVGDAVEVTSVRVIRPAYTQVASGPTPIASIPNPASANLAVTEFWVGDLPAMLDAHNGQHGFYLAAAPFIPPQNVPQRGGGSDWFGADIWVNMAGTNEATPAYEWLGYSDRRATIGQLKITAGQYRIYLRHGFSLQSMTDAEWNGGEQMTNLLMIGREVVQFRYATFLGGAVSSLGEPVTLEDEVPFPPPRPGGVGWKYEVFEITELRRGLRGTTPQEHYDGEPAVLYDPRQVLFIPWNNSNMQAFNLRAVTAGKSFQSALPLLFRYEPELNNFSWAVSWTVTELTPKQENKYDLVPLPTDGADFSMS